MKNKKTTAPIIEIFSSIQGEGLFIGERQIFVRFAGCNLKCSYCDTNWVADENTKNMTSDEMIDYIKNDLDFDFDLHKTLVFTGGEPLLQSDFIKECADKIHDDLQMNIILETNGTLPKNLLEVVDLIDIVSTDFKFQKYLPSQSEFSSVILSKAKDIDFSARLRMTNDKNVLLSSQTQFLQILMENGKDFYVKLVCDEQLSFNEFAIAIDEIHKIAEDAIIVIQPIMTDRKFSYFKKFDEFFKIALRKFRAKDSQVKGDVLLLPQIHKFLGIK